jgi:hypothetical protein
MQAPPHARSLPVAQATPAGHATAAAHLLGQHLPGNTTLQDKHNAAKRGPVGNTAWTAASVLGPLGRQQRGDDTPQFIIDQCFAHGINLPYGVRLC